MYRLLVVALALCVATGPAASAKSKVKVKPQRVVVVEGAKPAKVTEKDLVRIVQTAIAGSEITAKVSGPGKLVATAYIRRIKDGTGLLGNVVKEYTIKPSGTGTIHVTVTVQSPTAKEAQEHQYTVEVE